MACEAVGLLSVISSGLSRQKRARRLSALDSRTFSIGLERQRLRRSKPQRVLSEISGDEDVEFLAFRSVELSRDAKDLIAEPIECAK